MVPKAEKVKIILVGLSLNFGAILTLASFSSNSFPLLQLVDVLMEFESHQAHAMTDASVHAHLVEATSSTPMAEPVRGGHPPSSVRG